MTKLTPRDKAARAGLKRYTNGIPCKRGHIAERYTINAGCCECYYIRRKPSLLPDTVALRTSVVNTWNKKQPITMRQIGEKFGITRGVASVVCCLRQGSKEPMFWRLIPTMPQNGRGGRGWRDD